MWRCATARPGRGGLGRRYELTLHNGQTVTVHTQLTADGLTEDTQMALARTIAQFMSSEPATA
jgi:hypothetical protein